MKWMVLVGVAILLAAGGCASIADGADRFTLRANGLLSRLPGSADPPPTSNTVAGQQMVGNQQFATNQQFAGQQQFGGGVIAQQSFVQQPFVQQPFVQQPIVQQQPVVQQQPLVQQASLPTRPGPDFGVHASASPIAATQGQISDVQIKLYSLNINPGPPNGVLGLDTANAIAFFQRRVGMRVDGAISEMLIVQLERAVSQAGAARRLR